MATDYDVRVGLQTLAMQRVMQKFGILQMTRTGKISLKRGGSLLEEAGWPEGPTGRRQASSPVIEDTDYQESAADVYAVDRNQSGMPETHTSQLPCLQDARICE